MKVRIVQKDIHNRDYLSFISKAEKEGLDLVCLGELAVSGCLYDGGEGKSPEEMRAELSDFSIAVTIGFAQKVDESLTNSYLFYHHGKYQLYNKINLFPPMNEDKVYRPGTQAGIFETSFGRLGAAICYDLRFPEIFDALREKKAKMILMPAAWPRVRIDAWRELLIERAKQTALPVIGINTVGDDGTNEFGGSSMLVDGTGRVLEQLDEVSESFFDIEL